MAIVPTTANDEAEQEVFDRAKANPLIAVVDLERAFETYFDDIGHRSLDGALAAIKKSGIAWKSGSKA